MNPINPVCRPATENEINYGEAKWCAKCTRECDSKGKDELVMCDYFKTNDNDPIVPGCPSMMPHALPGGLDDVAHAEEGTQMPEPKDFAAKAKREREATREKSSRVGNAAKMREALVAMVEAETDGTMERDYLCGRCLERLFDRCKHDGSCWVDKVMNALAEAKGEAK